MITAKVAKQIKADYGIGGLLGTSSKVEKNPDGREVLVRILYLSPGQWLARHLSNSAARQLIGEEYASRVDGRTLPTFCPMAGACEIGCLAESAGMMRNPRNAAIRARRSIFLLTDREAFGEVLKVELAQLAKDASKLGVEPVVRLNGGSDLPWDAFYPWLKGFLQKHGIGRYEYTKVPAYARRFADSADFTFSRDGDDQTAIEALNDGHRVSVVFDLRPKVCRKGETIREADPMPATWKGFPVIDGDAHDPRWSEPQGVVVGLRMKGTNADKAEARQNGFSVAA